MVLLYPKDAGPPLFSMCRGIANSERLSRRRPGAARPPPVARPRRTTHRKDVVPPPSLCRHAPRSVQQKYHGQKQRHVYGKAAASLALLAAVAPQDGPGGCRHARCRRHHRCLDGRAGETPRCPRALPSCRRSARGDASAYAFAAADESRRCRRDTGARRRLPSAPPDSPRHLRVFVHLCAARPW